MILKNEKIIGVHDMIVHSYGPSCTIASCHVEVKATENFVAVHEIVDQQLQRGAYRLAYVIEEIFKY